MVVHVQAVQLMIFNAGVVRSNRAIALMESLVVSGFRQRYVDVRLTVHCKITLSSSEIYR